MKTMILSTVIAFLIASPVHADPLTWFFFGRTTSGPGGSPSLVNGVPLPEGRRFEFQISNLDTNVVGRIDNPPSAREVTFSGGGESRLEIEGVLDVLPVFPVAAVQYFMVCVDLNHCDETKPDDFLGRQLTGVAFFTTPGTGRQGIGFDSSIAFLRTPFDLFHLRPIGGQSPRRSRIL